MKLSPCSLSQLLLSALPLLLVSAKIEQKPVTELVGDQFKGFLESNEVVLVDFFAPWCGHCKSLAPQYEKAAEQLLEEDVKIRMATMDCTQESNKPICDSNEVRGYPTLKLFFKGKPRDYNGPREADGIVRYLKKQLQPAIQPLEAHQVDKFIKEERVVLVGGFAKGSKEMGVFEEVAEELRDDYSFGLLGDGPSLTLYKQFDDGMVKYTGKWEKEAILAWIKVEAMPLVDEISTDNYGKYMEANKPMLYGFYANDEQRKSVEKLFAKALSPYKGKIFGILIDAVKYGEHASNLNIEQEWPNYVLHNLESNLKYPLPSPKDLKEDGLAKFLKEYSAGTLKPKYKSLPIPEGEKGPLRTVVYENWDSVVMDKSKDVLVELMAPWCGYCKRMQPTVEKLAAKYAAHANQIVIAQFDGHQNDLPQSANFKLEHFPTFLLYKAGSDKGKPVELEGARDDLNIFIDFIAKHATNKVTVEREKEEKKKSEDAAEPGESIDDDNEEDRDEL